MRHSIRTKITLLIFVAIIFLSLILGWLSYYFTSKMTNEYAYQNVTLLCEKTATEINATYETMEKSVDYMSINALEEIANPMNLTDEIYYQNYIDKMKSILWNTSNNTDGAIAVYLRLNPDICGPTAGMFMTREKLGADMQSVSTTNLLEYDESDIEHVGWYYEPIKAGKPIWMMPYYNQNIGVYMISYVVPLFKKDVTVGVLGMDINFEYITEQIRNLKVYESGYAYITDANGMIIYHPELEYGDSFSAKDGWWNAECELNNGMRLNITAPISEINATHNDLMRNMFISALAIMIIFVVISMVITNMMITPLQKLNQIATEISEGNYDVDFDFKKPNDEIGQLAVGLENTVGTLKDYMSYINGIAYKDALTGVRNRTAYDQQLSMLEDDIKNGSSEDVAIAVFDVNNLKKINDSLGHEKGDILIKGACKIICRIFKHSAVFRIGGDEFVAIIREATDEKIDEVFDLFVKAMEETWSNDEPELQISVAYGYARYNPDTDANKIEPAFKRADEMMYIKKSEMKKGMR